LYLTEPPTPNPEKTERRKDNLTKGTKRKRRRAPLFPPQPNMAKKTREKNAGGSAINPAAAILMPRKRRGGEERLPVSLEQRKKSFARTKKQEGRAAKWDRGI